MILYLDISRQELSIFTRVIKFGQIAEAYDTADSLTVELAYGNQPRDGQIVIIVSDTSPINIDPAND
jgi:hypothetical protein